MKVDDLYAVAPGIAKIAPERRNQLQTIFFGEFFSHLRELAFVSNHDAKVTDSARASVLRFKQGQKLVFTQLEKGIAFAAIELFQVENVMVEFYRLFHVADLNCDMITAVNLDTHSLVIGGRVEFGRTIAARGR